MLKENYDQKAIYMLSSRTGELLWHTDAKDSRSPRPMHSMMIRGGRVYGIMPHPGQGFYFMGLDCRTGKRLFKREIKGYQGKPQVALLGRFFGSQLVARVADRQEFELRGFDINTGRQVAHLKRKGVGPIGVHGRISATVQNGRLILLSKNKLAP